MAEECKHAKELEEINLLYAASKGGTDYRLFEPQMAMKLARAARDTLLAEETYAKTRLEECEALMDAFRDDVEEVHSRVFDANMQLGYILNALNKWGINLTTPTKPLRSPPTYPVPLDYADGMLDNIDFDNPNSDLGTGLTSSEDESEGEVLD